MCCRAAVGGGQRRELHGRHGPVCKEHFPSRGGIPPESRMAFTVAGCYARHSHVHWMFESPSISQFPIYYSPGLGIFFARCLSDLGRADCRPLSALPLVSRSKRRRGDAWLSYL